MGATEILVSGGVAAILAAVVGGGLKAFGIELPLLASVQRQALLMAAGVALIALGLFAARPQAGNEHPPAGTPEGGNAAAAQAPSPVVPAPVAAAPAEKAATSARPDVPNIVGLPFSAARAFLTQNGWAPINSASSPMANPDLGLRAQEVFDSGYLEAVACSGSGMSPCLFRYQNPGGHILEVVAVGETLQSAVVNRAVILDCAADPKPDGC